MRILFLNIDRRHTCSFYRSGGISKDLANKLGATIDVQSFSDVLLDWQGIYNYDVVMIQRPYTDAALTYCKHVKQLHIPLWLDYDDDLFTVTPENRAWPVFDDPKVQDCIKQMMGMADVISVSNDYLKETTLKFNKNVVIIPNAFNDSIFPVDRVLPERKKTVLWRGSDTHIFDLMGYAEPMTRCIKEFPDWQFTFVGYNPWFLPKLPNIDFQKALDVIDYFDKGMELAPSVMQVPLADTPFNRSKSNIAFIEGAYWGAICVVPEWWNVPTLNYKSKEGYYEALTLAMGDNSTYNELGWNYVKDNLLLSNINKIRVELIKNL
jgi:hypothetical protein